MTYCSFITNLPGFLAYIVSFLVDYNGLIVVGIYVEIAALRIFAIVSVSNLFCSPLNLVKIRT